jgi:hypothetical protein
MVKNIFSAFLLVLILSSCGNKDAEIAECVRFNSDLVYNHYLPIYQNFYSAMDRANRAISSFQGSTNSYSVGGKAEGDASEARADEIPKLREECGKSVQYIWTPKKKKN